MTTKNPYRKNSHLGLRKTREILRYFSKDFTATQTSKLLEIERKTINKGKQEGRVLYFDCAKEIEKFMQKLSLIVVL